MEFRWVAALTLWTMLSGPILSQPAAPRPAPPPMYRFSTPANSTAAPTPKAVACQVRQ